MNFEIKYEYELIEIYKLNIDKSYQRDISQKKIKELIKNFDTNAFGQIFVNERNDNYFVVDGQHRLEAAKQKGYDIIPCMLTKGMTQEEEAKLFVNFQSNRNNPRTKDRFKAKLSANDRISLDIVSILNNYGMKPLLHGSNTINNHKKGYISNIATLEKIYNMRNGNMWLDKTLEIIKTLWFNGKEFEKDALHRDTIEGINYFLTRTYKKLDYNIFIKKIKKFRPEMLIKKQNSNLLIHGKGKSPNYARALLEEYNYKRHKRLEIKYN